MIGNIEVFIQNSIRIRSRVGVIYIDPFQMKEEPKDADFVLITHDHYDHFSPEDIGKVSKADTILVVPEKMASKAREVSGIVGKIEAVKCDIALVPIGGTYTMDAKKAAELINTIRPDVAIPVHYGHIVGKPSDGEVFAENVKDPIKVEFKIEF